MADQPTPSKKKSSPPGILTVEEVVAKSVFDKEFGDLKNALHDQQSITWQMVIGVAIAFVLAVGVIVVDAIYSRNSNIQEFDSVRKDINEQNIEINKIENDLENLRVRNPYLK